VRQFFDISLRGKIAAGEALLALAVMALS